MIPIKVASASLNQTPLDWAGNQRRIEAAIGEAKAAGVGLLVLPELCTTGYGCEDAFLGPDVAKRAWSMLMKLVPQTTGMVVSIGMPIRRRGGLYNTACVVADGRIAGFASVNRFFGSFKIDDRGKLEWPFPFGSTRMAGPPELMKQEDIFLNALPQTSSIAFEKIYLYMTSADKKTRLTFYVPVD